MEGVTSPPGSQNSSRSNSFLSPLLISTVGIVATSVAIIVYHLFLVKYCLRRRQETTATAARAVPVVSAGVDKKVLDAIPVIAFSAVKGGDQYYLRSDQAECVVCLGELEDEDLVRSLPTCNHAFHVPCIDQWFLAHTSCPLCRSPILPPEDPRETPEEGAAAAQTNYENPDEEACYTPENRGPSLPSGRRTSGMLRHCMSLELPQAAVIKSPPRNSVGGLNRSISMDTSFAVINIQNEVEIRANDSDSGTASSSSLKRSESYTARPVSQIDRMSSKLRRSFSRLRSGKGSQVGPILPY
ncbi:E3 ubiquitin-protein ligase Os04g0590900-like [Henckelia pumila]|uniref:E3 ubiquitin-protein ligase Os04g0590900-like n=1 Tax=Henckelia pumila TaxID=405737 RepID=UPI003C6DDEC7